MNDIIIPPPHIIYEDNKTIFTNIVDVVKSINRPVSHFIQYLKLQLITGIELVSNKLIIDYIYNEKQVDNILKRYIGEYLVCRSCKGPNTILNHDYALSSIQCESCGYCRFFITKIKHF